MATTVTVSDETHRLLKKLKEERGSSSFDVLLREVTEQELDVPDSLKGKAKLKVDKADVRERRDRSERYVEER
ncbi:MAG: hypothetical protein ABEK00_01440 [Candidatus Nanohaloarchaea archaeon]